MLRKMQDVERFLHYKCFCFFSFTIPIHKLFPLISLMEVNYIFCRHICYELERNVTQGLSVSFTVVYCICTVYSTTWNS